MRILFLSLFVGLFLITTACNSGNNVELNYSKMEKQYVELTEYYGIAVDEGFKNEKEASEFVRHYLRTRDSINYYNHPLRDRRYDVSVLWNMKWELNEACKHTNSLMNNLDPEYVKKHPKYSK